MNRALHWLRQSRQTDNNLSQINAIGLAVFKFFFLNAARGISDVGVLQPDTGAKQFQAAT